MIFSIFFDFLHLSTVFAPKYCPVGPYMDPVDNLPEIDVLARSAFLANIWALSPGDFERGRCLLHTDIQFSAQLRNGKKLWPPTFFL